ncbi:MAG: alkaline phosphatase family protein [Bacteroidetes bacterium]|nr:alkaline phosphatase family protein [Bacteroidota bacterium]
MLRITILLTSIFALTNVCFASETVNKPKVIINVVVDAMRNDDFMRYAKNYSNTGFNKLINKGVYATNAHYSNIPANTMVSAATIITGSNPRQHGIIGKEWYANGQNFLTMAIDTSREITFPAPLYSIIDKIKYNDSASKVISIAIDKNTAIISGDATTERVIWLDKNDGQWKEVRGLEKEPWWLTILNNGKTKKRYDNTPWTATYSKEAYINQNSYKLFKKDTSKKSKHTKTITPIEETPFCNSYLNDCLSSLFTFDKIGKDTVCDFVTINLGFSKSVYEKYGAKSIETEDMFYKIDKEISRLINMLDHEVGKDEYLLIFTSASGMSDGTSKNEGGVFNQTKAHVLVNAFLSAQYGVDNWVSGYKNNEIYFNHKTIYRRKVSLEELQNAVANFIIKFNGVETAYTATSLTRTSYYNGIDKRIYNSFNFINSGDVIVVLKPNWLSVVNSDFSKNRCGNIAPWENIVSVPLLIYGKGVKHKTIRAKIDMTDIAPTIAEIMGVSRPEKAIGNSFTNNIYN